MLYAELVPPLSPSWLLNSPRFAGSSQSSTALAGSSMVDSLSRGVCSPFSLLMDAEVSLEEQRWPGAGRAALAGAEHAGSAVS